MFFLAIAGYAIAKDSCSRVISSESKLSITIDYAWFQATLARTFSLQLLLLLDRLLFLLKKFIESCLIPECDFRFLKIWLYDTEISDRERGYEITKIDERDLCLLKNNFLPSKLEKLFVLDNE